MMSKMLSREDWQLHDAFRNIIAYESLPIHTLEIAELIYNDDLALESLNGVLSKYVIKNIRNINNDLLDLVILYIHEVLKDGVIEEQEKRNIEVFKLYFKIREGDFYQKKKREIENILRIQFEKLYFDDKITKEEAFHNFLLRDIFDLSHEQYDRFKEKEVRRALDNGSNIKDLDTSIIPKK